MAPPTSALSSAACGFAVGDMSIALSMETATMTAGRFIVFSRAGLFRCWKSARHKTSMTRRQDGRAHEEHRDLDQVNIQFTLFSAFYSPLISAMSGGFLKAEGLDPQWSVSPPGVSALAALKDGAAHVVQSALSQGFTSLNKGETPEAVHFAQVNEMDGFFLAGREADPAFTWSKLEGAEVVMFNGGQPLAMFKYACHKAGIDFNRIKAIYAAGPAEVDRTFRSGQGQ